MQVRIPQKYKIHYVCISIRPSILRVLFLSRICKNILSPAGIFFFWYLKYTSWKSWHIYTSHMQVRISQKYKIRNVCVRIQNEYYCHTLRILSVSNIQEYFKFRRRIQFLNTLEYSPFGTVVGIVKYCHNCDCLNL